MTDTPVRPRVLLVCYSYTGQSRKVLAAAGRVFSQCGCDVEEAAIEFTDRRYGGRFAQFPMAHVWRTLLSVLPAQLRGAVGEIRVPDGLGERHYDLVCIGSPTWWGTAAMPVRSFLASRAAANMLAGTPFAVFVVCRQFWRRNRNVVRHLARRGGGRFAGDIHFTYPGGPLRSLLALTSYLASGECRDRYLGVRLPPTNIQPEHLTATREFAAELAGHIFGARLHQVGG